MTLTNKPNSEQLEAIQHTEGPLLIIAGPGSGKTKTLVDRVIHLIQKGVSPDSILVATFTEKTAKELVTRISNVLAEVNIKADLNKMYIGTLHSIFLRILEENTEYTRLRRNYRLFDPFEQTFNIYRNYFSFLNVPHLEALVGEHIHNRWAVAKAIAANINVVSEEMLEAEKLIASDDAAIHALGECYQRYQKLLDEDNAVDFSTIQSECLSLLVNHPNVLESLQDKIRYFMIDEYQDTNAIQERIILLLSSKDNNLCVVGDDDQGLYRFRGATIRNILEFEKNYPEGKCRKIYLETNYRSHPGIIDFYNRWMASLDWTHEGVSLRFDKTIKPCQREFPETASVIKVTGKSAKDTYFQEVLSFIKALQENGTVSNLNQIAYIARSVKGSEVVALSQYLEENGIRVFSPRSELFFQRNEIKLILGCLLSVFPMVCEVFSEYDEEIAKLCESWRLLFEKEVQGDPAANKNLILWVINKQKEHLSLTKHTNYAFSGLLYQMLQFPLFARYLDVDLSANKSDLRPAYNIGIFTTLLSKFEYLYNVTIFTSKDIKRILKEFFCNYLKFIMDGGLGEYEDFDETAPSGCMSIMTIHQAKGLEFPVTMVGSMNAVPRKAYNDLDEKLQTCFYHKPVYEPLERTKFYDFYRLFYTAFSRAQNLLVLTGYEHSGAGALPSWPFKRFWDEVPSWRETGRFDMRKLDLAEVKPVNIKHEYAFTSHIILYEGCPLQYKFYKELEFAEVRQGGAIGGTLLHETIEDIHKAVLRGEEHTLTDENIYGWFNANYQLLVKQLRSFIREEQRNAILKQVFRYRDNNNGHWDAIKEAEVDVSLVKDDYILKGKIDLVRGENGTVELVDFKSGDKPDVNTRDEYKRTLLNQYRRQLEVYAHIIEKSKGVKVSKMHLYYPKEENGNPRITYEYNESEVSATIDSFDKIVKKIESKDFSMKGACRNEKHCSECDMRFYCNNKY